VVFELKVVAVLEQLEPKIVVVFELKVVAVLEQL
jgi:hypothetical protein